MFKSVITTIPVTSLKKTNLRLNENTDIDILETLAIKYTEQTGTTITNDYELHIFHVDEILMWEETKETVGPFFTSVLTNDIGDPLRYLASLLITARGRKNIIVIEVDDKNKINKIRNKSLKLAIESETIFISH